MAPVPDCAICLYLLQGEKFLVLKKKYRQVLQERDGRPPRADVDGHRPARSPAGALWDAPAASSGRPDAEVTSLNRMVDSAATLQNPEVSERAIGPADSDDSVTLHATSLPTETALLVHAGVSAGPVA